MPALSPQEIAEIRKQYNIQPVKAPAASGGTDEAYRSARTERLKALRQQPAQGAAPEQEQGFLSRVGSDIRKRADEAFDTLGEAARGEITPVESAGRIVGQGLAVGGDIVGEGLTSAYRTVVPEKAQDVIEQGVGRAAQAVGLPKAMEKYEKFAEANPRAAKNVEAIANIGLNLPGVAGTKVVGEAAEVAAKQGVKAAAKSVSKKAMTKLEDQYSALVRLSRKAKQAEAEWGKNTARLLAEEGGVDLDVLPDKTLDTYSSAVPQIKTKLDEASQAVKKVIADSGVYGNIDEAERAALKANEVNRKLGTVYKQNQEQIKREFAAIRDNYKDVATITEEGETLLPLSAIDEAKSGAWDRAFSGAPLATSKAAQDTDFAIGKSLQKTIEDGIDDAPIKEMNRKVGDYAEALDVLRNAHGMVLPGGRIGRYTAQAIGAGVGSVATGGVGGGLVGYFVADKLADALANPATRTSYLRKILEKAGATKNQSKEVVEEALKILDSRRGAK